MSRSRRRSARPIALFLPFLLFFVGAAGSARAQQDRELDYRGIRYVCTGIAESRLDPRWAAYPLKLMFTTGGHAYIINVRVTIRDAKGRAIFEAFCPTPWLLVALAPGRYRVTAVAQRKYRKSARVRVRAGRQTARAIRFPEMH